jgi:hypothetical protein
MTHQKYNTSDDAFWYAFSVFVSRKRKIGFCLDLFV